MPIFFTQNKKLLLNPTLFTSSLLMIFTFALWDSNEIEEC